MPENENQQAQFKPGDEVQWNYGSGHPTGTVAEVKTDAGGKLEIETKKGNTIHKKSDPENPAVRIGTDPSKSDVVKRASELTKIGEAGGEEKGEVSAKEAKVGEKRERETGEAASREKGEMETTQEKEQQAVEREAGKETKKPRMKDAEDAGTKENTAEGKEGEAQAPAGRGGKRGRGGGKGSKGGSTKAAPRGSARTTRRSTAATKAKPTNSTADATATEDANPAVETEVQQTAGVIAEDA